MAGSAEYYNRLARHHGATINPPGAWVGRISTELAMRVQLFKTVKKVRQQILRRAAYKSLAEKGLLCWPVHPLRPDIHGPRMR
jgi:hypothetical protein